jgi:putative ABC transport system permease protein
MRRFLLRLLSFVRFNRADADLARELEAHLRLLEDRFVVDGMPRDEASAAARRAFGGQLEQVKARHRDARSFRWLDESWLDAKLGARMLIKYPGLTLIAVVALSVAIGGGAAYLEFVNDAIRPRLPVTGGDRIVGIQLWDTTTGEADHRALHDFAAWREGVTSVEDLGAYRPMEHNLITEEGRAEPVHGVEINASAFRLVPTPPQLGRTLIEADERPGSPPVVVLGHGLWQARFGSDPAIVGRTVRLGSVAHTVVGVMPEGFGFPVNHVLWAPLRLSAAGMQRGQGPPIKIFGRLALGVRLETAQSELTSLALRRETDSPAANHRLRPRIRPYVESLWSSFKDGLLQMRILYAVNLFFVALLAVCGANVATLVFGRTIMREGEITLRTALGASRGRIVAQLFVEALVLSSLAAAVGLAVASYGLRWGKAAWLSGTTGGAAPPFWWNDRLSVETFLYAGLLALLAAVMVGVLPALKATGAQMQSRLKTAAAGGTSMKFGGAWTAVIVTQVAITVVFLLAVVSLGWNYYANEYRGGDVAFPREKYLSARLEPDREKATPILREFERRLNTEPGVVGVTHATAFPGMKHSEFFVEFQSIAPSLPADRPLWVQSAAVAASFFDTFDARIIAGRAFTPADVNLDRPVAIVDQTFVQKVLGGRSPVGQWVRQPQNSERPRPGPWYEIVGVVSDLSVAPTKTSEDAVLYRPATPGADAPVWIAVRVDDDARSLAPRLRTIAAAVDPTLRLYDVMRLDQVNESDQLASQFFLRALALVSAVALTLSTAGVYSLMAFTVARRTREIAIRAAVGADRRHLLKDIFSRAFGQVAVGVAAGSIPGALLVAAGAPEIARGSAPSVAAVALAGVATFMLTVTLLACSVPARRVLRIEPVDALRAE